MDQLLDLYAPRLLIDSGSHMLCIFIRSFAHCVIVTTLLTQNKQIMTIIAMEPSTENVCRKFVVKVEILCMPRNCRGSVLWMDG